MARQQRLILQQQRQILRNQQLLEAQNRQLSGNSVTPAYSGDATTKAVAGLLGFTCPPHHHVNMAYGCLPDLNYVH